MSSCIVSQSASSLKVRLVPELCQAARKIKQHKEIAVWSCLRSINNWGSGSLPLRLALDSLCESFNYSVSTAYDILSKGSGVYWERRTGKRGAVVKIGSLANVARHLGVAWLSRFYVIPADQFNSLQWRNAWMFSVFYEREGKPRTRPISRLSIEDATGVIPKTQQRYEALTGVRKNANYVVDDTGKQVKHEVVGVCKGKSRTYNIDRQLGNTYHCPVVTTVRGMCRRIKDAVKSCDGEEALAARRFFYSTRKLFKTPDRASESFLAVPDNRSRFPRAVRGEWCIV